MSDAEIARRAITDLVREEANKPVLSDDDLYGITSFTEAMQFADTGNGVEDYADYGTGFEVVDKETLLRTPFVILEWRFHDGDIGEFVSFSAVTEDGRKVVVNDGSTGILQQLRKVSDKRIENGVPDPQTRLLVKKGLRVSRYKFLDDKGKERDAATYYLA